MSKPKIELKSYIWVPLNEENGYSLSNYGDIRRDSDNYMMHPYTSCQGYVTYRIKKNNNTNRYKLHVLMAKYFLPNPLNLPVVDHINRDKNNNKLSNLRWTTHQTNAANQVKRQNTKSKYKGLRWHNTKWEVYITQNYKKHYIGGLHTDCCICAL